MELTSRSIDFVERAHPVSKGIFFVGAAPFHMLFNQTQDRTAPSLPAPEPNAP